MFCDAHGNRCSRWAIKTHNIQKGGPLKHLASGTGKLFLPEENSFAPNIESYVDIKKVGIGRASTFFGFCSAHDNDLFADFENNALAEIEPQHLTRISYRSICAQLNETLVRLEAWRRIQEKPNIHTARFISSMSGFFREMQYRVRDFQAEKVAYEQLIAEDRTSNLSTFFVEFDTDMPFSFVGSTALMFDFQGQRIPRVVGQLWPRMNFVAGNFGGRYLWMGCGINRNEKNEAEQIVRSLQNADQDRFDALLFSTGCNHAFGNFFFSMESLRDKAIETLVRREVLSAAKRSALGKNVVLSEFTFARTPFPASVRSLKFLP